MNEKQCPEVRPHNYRTSPSQPVVMQFLAETASLPSQPAWLIIIEPTASTDITLGRMDLGILFGPRLMNREALPFVVKSKSNA